MAKKVLVLYPRPLDYHHLMRINHLGKYEFVFDTLSLETIVRQGYSPDDSFKAISQKEIEVLINQVGRYDGIIATHDYPGTLVASLYADRWELPFPSVESILSCQHKYYFRQLLKKAVPEATPEFQLVDERTQLQEPLFVKPIKSSFSRYAKVVTTQEELTLLREMGLFDPSYLSLFNELFQTYIGIALDANAYIAEDLLTGVQVSLEGYVYKGEVTILGIIDADMYEGTLSFDRFSYPSLLSVSVQQRMHTIAKKAVTALGLDATLFSVELMYDKETEKIGIIEINPRISAQFADFFEQVHGVNSYEILIALSLGEQPPVLGTGSYTYAGSFPLRVFEDYYVEKVPTEKELEQIRLLVPDLIIQITAKEGQRLSELQQDGNSYLYAVINIAADSYEELLQKRDQIAALLAFSFT